MNKTKLAAGIWTIALVLTLCAPLARSQQGSSATPTGASTQTGTTGEQGGNTSGTPGQTMTPDTNPLAGSQELSLGALAGERSYLLPGVVVGQTVDTNAQIAPGKSNVVAGTVLGGELALHRVGRRNELIANYQVGGVIYESSQVDNSSFHQLGLTDVITLPRWQLQLSDRFSYLPDASFGFAGLSLIGGFDSGLAIPSLGGTLPEVNAQFLPSQSIFTGFGSRYSNAVIGQIQRQLGPRSSVTAVGSYQILQFKQPGFIDSNSTVFQFGYDRQLTARDTIGLSYAISLFRYNGTDFGFNTHLFGLNYGRRITGRLALRAFAGPEIVTIGLPGQPTSTRTFFSVNGFLTYSLRNTDFSLGYFRGTTGGSGQSQGARTNAITGSISRQFTRTWTGTLGGGYARNSQVISAQPGRQLQTYNGEHAGARVSWEFHRYAKLFFAYNLETQNSNLPFTAGNSMGRSLLRHVFAVGLDWNYRPIGL